VLFIFMPVKAWHGSAKPDKSFFLRHAGAHGIWPGTDLIFIGNALRLLRWKSAK